MHAGDLMRIAVLRELESYGPVVAVHGNVDDAEVRAALPPVASVEVPRMPRSRSSTTLARREGGSSGMRKRFPEADAVVFGHSHLPLHEHSRDGFQIFNPGSPTERRRAPRHTMGIATVSGGRVAFELIAVG